MSDEGIRLITRVALVVLLVVATAFFRALVGQNRDTAMNRVTPFLMFNDQLEAAIETGTSW